MLSKHKVNQVMVVVGEDSPNLRFSVDCVITEKKNKDEITVGASV